MVSILPLKDKDYLNRLNEAHGTSAGLAFCLRNGDSVEGYVLYDISQERGLLQAYKANSEIEADGIIRAVLASLHDFGIDSAVYSDKFDRDMLIRLGVADKQGSVSEIKSIHAMLYRCEGCSGACDNCSK